MINYMRDNLYTCILIKNKPNCIGKLLERFRHVHAFVCEYIIPSLVLL